MPKIKYKINKVCNRCDELKQTRYDGNQVYVCKTCDDNEDRETLTHTYKKAS